MTAVVKPSEPNIKRTPSVLIIYPGWYWRGIPIDQSHDLVEVMPGVYWCLFSRHLFRIRLRITLNMIMIDSDVRWWCWNKFWWNKNKPSHLIDTRRFVS